MPINNNQQSNTWATEVYVYNTVDLTGLCSACFHWFYSWFFFRLCFFSFFSWHQIQSDNSIPGQDFCELLMWNTNTDLLAWG